MNQKLIILIIEDHPLISSAYTRVMKKLSNENNQFEFEISTAKNCDEANDAILAAEKNEGLDIVFLDINIPPSHGKGLLSGEDIGLKIKRLLPKTKIIVSTSYLDKLRIQNIVENLNPDGFLIKNDFNAEELKSAINNIIYNPPYYSRTVLASFKKKETQIYVIDEIDRQLLFELSVGTKMNQLSKIIPLSIGGIERRKRRLRDIFNLSNNDHRDLILIAKEKGFL